MTSPMPDAEALCLVARERRTGPTLTADEVLHYLALLGDERTLPDPDDPPSYDWTGGPSLAGGGQMQVCREAAATLRACGGEALVAEIKARIDSAGAQRDSGVREDMIRLALDLLGARHVLIATLLNHDALDVRVMMLRAFEPLGWRIHEYVDLLAPFLMAENVLAAQQVCVLMHKAGTWLNAKQASRLPAGLLDTSVQRLQQASVADQSLRVDCVVYASVLSDDWVPLAQWLNQRTPQEVLRVVSLPCFAAQFVAPLLNAQPALRDTLRIVVYARFRAGRPGWRYHELALVCCFAPEHEALELGIEELTQRASAGMELAVFIQHVPARVPQLLEVAILSATCSQVDAHGIQRLLSANLPACAQALAAAPATLSARLQKIRKVLSYLPSSRDADTHMAALMAQLEELKPPA